jgi:hypothetical protein
MLTARAGSGRGPLLRVFLLTFVVYAYFMPRWADWNIDSRFDLVRSMIDHASLTIDPYHWNTWDKAVDKGHYYSDKAPGSAVLGSAVYSVFKLARQTPVIGGGIHVVEQNSAWNVAIQLGKTDTQQAPAAKGRRLGGCQRAGPGNVQFIPWGNRLVPPMRDWAFSKYIVTIGAVALLSALFATFFFWFISLFTSRRIFQWTLTGLYALATVALPYSTVLYSHQMVAAFLFVAFALLFLRSQGRVGAWAAPAVGFLLGLSLFTEYTVGLIIVAIGVYALWVYRRRVRELLPLCIAGALPVAGLMAYNYACFGSVLDTGYTHDFCWSSAQAAGFAGFTSPKLGPLFDLTFGPFRGLFYMSPFLFLAVPGAYLMIRRGLRTEAALCLITSIGFILAISAYWGWNGGQVDGPRYIVPIVPFLAFPIVFFLDRWGATVAGAILTALLGVLSVFVTWCLFLGGLTFPTSWLRVPLTDYSFPMLAGNHIAPNAGFFLGLSGWQSLLPLALIVAVIAGWPGRRVSRPGARATSPVPAAE